MQASPDDVIDVDPITDKVGDQPTTAALVPAAPNGPATIPVDMLVRPVASADTTVAAFVEYENLKKRLLVPSDYQGIGDKSFTKKSGWRKLSTVMGVSNELISRTYDRDDQGRITRAEVVIRAIAPNGRFQDGLGICDYRERCTPGCFNENRRGGPCDGFNHFSKAQHDIPATAATRAQNRASSDLFGFGEVSAEEIQGESAPPPPGFESHDAARARYDLILESVHDLDGYRTKGEGGPLPGSDSEKFAAFMRRNRHGTPPWTAEQCDAIEEALNDLIPDPTATPAPAFPPESSVAPSHPQQDRDESSGSGGGEVPGPRSESSAPASPPTPPTGGTREAPPVGEPPADESRPAHPSAGGAPSTKSQRTRIGITANNLLKTGAMIEGDKAQLVEIITHDRAASTVDISEAEAARMIAALRFLTNGEITFVDDPDGDGARALASNGPAGETFIRSINETNQ